MEKQLRIGKGEKTVAIENRSNERNKWMEEDQKISKKKCDKPKEQRQRE